VLLVLAGPPAAAVDPAGAVARPVARPVPPAVPAPRMDYVRVVDRPWQRVTITVTATDRRGRPVRGLQAADFRVTDAGQPVTLADFGPEEGRRDRPLSVAVLLDLSESMAGQVGKVEEAARALLAGLRPGDEVMVARFNHQLTILQPFTGRLPEGAGRLRDLGAASGGTALFHAISSTLLELRDRPGRKIVLVVSDGVDTVLHDDRPVLQSLYFQELVRLCFRTGTTVYGVRPGITSGNMAFEDFVEETGGRLVYTGEGLDRLFARLGEEFLSQYVLAWDADPKSFAAEWRRIQVDVRRPGVTIAALRGFLTPRGQVDVDLRHLADDEPGTRADAAWDLGFIDEPRVREALRGRLDDEDARVRRRAAEALGRLRDPEAQAPLAERLGDADPLVVEAAAAALEGFGPAAIGALGAACAASAAEPRRAAAAATVLGRVGDQRALEPLAALLASPAPEARLAAARAIAELGLVAGVGPLRGVLEDPDPGLRRAALRGIAGLAQEAARPILEDHLRREKDPAVREALMAMLEPAPRRAEPTR
jgi:Ca-activated chloride channel homolog